MNAMQAKYFLLILLLSLFVACKNSNEREKKASKHGYEIDETLPPSGDQSSTGKDEKLATLISDSKRTLDSIDIAYSVIRKESRRQSLSLDEREQVNEALIELNDAKDLIVLEMQHTVIDELKEKTAFLQNAMQDMHTKSEKLLHIAQTLSRVSSMIEKTTNLLAGALSSGIIRPRITGPGPAS